MARMTAQDFVNFTRKGVSETDETLSDADLLRLVNLSYIELAASVKFPELEETTTVTLAGSTAQYELDVDDILYVSDVVDTTSKIQLEPMNRYQYNNFTQGSTVLGSPQNWFISGLGSTGNKNITFFPTPSAAGTVTIYYWERPTELVLTPDPSSPILPEIWDDSILHRAIARAWRLLGDISKSKQWMDAVRESDLIAYNITQYASNIPTSPGSIVGASLR